MDTSSIASLLTGTVANSGNVHRANGALPVEGENGQGTDGDSAQGGSTFGRLVPQDGADKGEAGVEANDGRPSSAEPQPMFPVDGLPQKAANAPAPFQDLSVAPLLPGDATPSAAPPEDDAPPLLSSNVKTSNQLSPQAAAAQRLDLVEPGGRLPSDPIPSISPSSDPKLGTKDEDAPRSDTVQVAKIPGAERSGQKTSDIGSLRRASEPLEFVRPDTPKSSASIPPSGQLQVAEIEQRPALSTAGFEEPIKSVQSAASAPTKALQAQATPPGATDAPVSARVEAKEGPPPPKTQSTPTELEPVAVRVLGRDAATSNGQTAEVRATGDAREATLERPIQKGDGAAKGALLRLGPEGTSASWDRPVSIQGSSEPKPATPLTLPQAADGPESTPIPRADATPPVAGAGVSSGAAATGVIDGIRPQASARAPGTTPGDAPDRRTDPAEETESLDTRKTLRRDVSQNGASPPDQRVALPTHGDQTLRQNSGLALPDTALSPGDMPVEAEFVATETVLRETTGPQSASAFDAPRQPAPKAQAVLAQIAEAARTRQDGQIEITLSPEELGRVRLTMAPSDYGMSVTILAERPETLDLIRRHIDLLSRDLQGQGFGKLDFSFAGSGSDGGGSFEGQFGRAGAASPGEIAAPADELWAPPQAAPTGLDMRL